MYFSTPGWISSCRGAAMSVLASVDSFACSSFAPSDPWALCSARDLVGGFVGQPRPCEHQRPGAERGDRRGLPGVASRRKRDRLDERIFREDALQLLGGRRDKAC